jgi:hypothetical protein
MQRLVLIIAAAALVLPATAAAKGPSGADINGPGTGGGISIGGGGGGDPSAGTPLGNLTLNAGFFPGMFGQTPDPMLDGRPRGALGPKYTITWTVPGPNGDSTVKQDLYPYAKAGAVTYMKPGQPFWDRERTHGGWFAGGIPLKQTLVAAGLSRTPPSSTGAGWFAASSVGMWLTFAAVLVAAAAAAAIVRRRARPATV